MTISARFSLTRDTFTLNVDLNLPASGITAVFGPSGSGKTTLLRAIAGLEHIPNAQISFQGHTWQDDRIFVPTHLRRLGYVFQQSSLFPHLTVRGNLEFGLRRVPADRRRINLDDAVDLLGIGTLLERDPLTLSGGEQQRVAIARTLVTSPRLLLMDEPLSSLDQKRKLEILPYLETLHRELALPVLYVSHATDEVARLADELVILRNGSIMGSGPIQQMLTRLDLPLAHRGDAETILRAIVRRLDDNFGLAHLQASDNEFIVASAGLKVGAEVRLRIYANDVSLTLERQRNTSIQNIFPVTVAETVAEGGAQAMVKVMLGDNPLLVRVTQKSVTELRIAAGRQLYAQVKGVAVLA